MGSIRITLLAAAVFVAAATAQTPGPGPTLMLEEAERAYARALAHGRRLFSSRTPPLSATGASCASCHGADARGLAGVARRYPLHDPKRGRVIPLEEKIALEIRERMRGAAPAPGSPASIALLVFVSNAGRR